MYVTASNVIAADEAAAAVQLNSELLYFFFHFCRPQLGNKKIYTLYPSIGVLTVRIKI